MRIVGEDSIPTFKFVRTSKLKKFINAEGVIQTQATPTQQEYMPKGTPTA